MLGWVLLVVGLATLLYWILTRNHGYWQTRGVYCLPGAVPWVGHMWEAALLRASAGWVYCRIYHQTKGHPAVGIYGFNEPSLLLRDLNLIQTVTISDFSSFHDNAMWVDEELNPYVNKNPFVLKGQRWKILRQQLSPALSPVRIKAMFPLLQKVCQEFNTYMEKRLNEDINVNYVTGLLTSEIVAKCAFGLEGNAFNDANSEFYNHGRKMWDASVYNPFLILVVQFFPFINTILRQSFFPKDTIDFFVSLIKQAADYREKNPDKVPDNDYLQFLFNLHKKNPDFTLDDVVAQSLTFFTDGFETTSLAASFALHELAMHPEMQAAVREEVQSMESFSYDSITTLSLLDRVFQETVRKYSVFSLVKECTKDSVLQADGHSYPVTKGQQVIIPVGAIHKDPLIYPDPERFDPDRFLPENTKNRHPMSYLSFGAGPRMCIGNRFAICQVKVLIANILANFQLLKCEKTDEKMEIILHHNLPIAKNGIWLKFQKL